MPGTWRTFLQGIGNALPQIVQMREREEYMRLEEERLAQEQQRIELQGRMTAVAEADLKLRQEAGAVDVEGKKTQNAMDKIRLDIMNDAEIGLEATQKLAVKLQNLELAQKRREDTVGEATMLDQIKGIRTELKIQIEKLKGLNYDNLSKVDQIKLDRIKVVQNLLYLQTVSNISPDELLATIDAKDLNSALSKINTANMDQATKDAIRGTLGYVIETRDNLYNRKQELIVTAMLPESEGGKGMDEASAISFANKSLSAEEEFGMAYFGYEVPKLMGVDQQPPQPPSPRSQRGLYGFVGGLLGHGVGGEPVATHFQRETGFNIGRGGGTGLPIGQPASVPPRPTSQSVYGNPNADIESALYPTIYGR